MEPIHIFVHVVVVFLAILPFLSLVFIPGFLLLVRLQLKMMVPNIAVIKFIILLIFFVVFYVYHHTRN